MRFHASLNWAGALALVALCSGACKKSAERQIAADERVDETEDDRQREQARTASREHLAAIRLEQLDLRRRLQQAVADIDRDLLTLDVDPKETIEPTTEAGRRARDLVDHRRRLGSDIGAIERSDERDWEIVKREVEADLGAATPGI